MINARNLQISGGYFTENHNYGPAIGQGVPLLHLSMELDLTLDQSI